MLYCLYKLSCDGDGLILTLIKAETELISDELLLLRFLPKLLPKGLLGGNRLFVDNRF